MNMAPGLEFLAGVVFAVLSYTRRHHIDSMGTCYAYLIYHVEYITTIGLNWL